MTTWQRNDSDLEVATGLASTTVGSVRIIGTTIGLESDTDILTFSNNTLDITAGSGVSLVNSNLLVKDGGGNTTITLAASGGTVTANSFSGVNLTGVIQTASHPNITTLANLVTVGTITTGAWRGSAIADGYISSSSAWNAKLDSSGTIADNDYAKYNASGDLTGRSYSEVKSDLNLTDENIQDIVGAMFSGNTETNISVVYQDGDGTIDLTAEIGAADIAGFKTEEQIQDIVGAMFTSNTETRISATYQDGDGTIDLVVDDMTVPSNITISANNSSDETVYPVFVDGATGSQGLESDTGLTYNPNSGVLTATNFTGAVTGDVTGNVSGSAGSATLASTITTADATADTTNWELTMVSGSATTALKRDDGLIFRADTHTLTTVNLSATGTVTGAGGFVDGDMTLTTNELDLSSGNFKLDIEGDITLDANGGNIFIKDDSQDHFEFNCDNTYFDIFDDEDTGDYFRIQVAQHGATTISTVDDDANAGHMTISPDGDMTIAPAGATKISGSTTVDLNTTATTSGTTTGLIVDYDHTGITASGQSIYNRGIDVAVNTESVTHVGTLRNIGINNTVTGSTAGTSLNYGIYNTVTGSDIGYGYYSIVDDGQIDIRLESSQNFSDYCEIHTTTNGATTIKTIDSSASSAHFILDIDGDITLDADGGQVRIKDAGSSQFLFDCDSTSLTIYDDTDSADLFSITVGASGATTIATVDDGAAVGHLTLDPDGDLVISGADTKIDATQKLYIDGGGDTYIHESSADVIQLYAGGDKVLEVTEATTGNVADFGTTGVGFTQFEPTYNASDTNVNFNDNGNKAFATFGAGNITDMNLYFPNVSCNCVLVLKQDGTGSRTVTNWKTFDQADGNESTVVWAGGSAPTLTTGANKIDIISFYWDNDNHKAYGVASLNF